MTGRRALVTGASSGIGAATAIKLAQEGNDLHLTYASNERAVRETAERCAKHGAQPLVSELDLRSEASIRDLVGEVSSSWEHLHVLVNNGGTCPYQSMDEISFDDWDLVMETNARGTFFLTRALLPLLRNAAPADRSIVNVSSVAGEVGGIQTGVHYAASKAAILAMTRSLARVLAVEGIRVNAVCPGPVSGATIGQLSEERLDQLRAGVPLGRFGDADEVAWIIASLADARASFVTGGTYDVNGGVRIG